MFRQFWADIGHIKKYQYRWRTAGRFLLGVLLGGLLCLTVLGTSQTVAQGTKGQESTVKEETISTAWIVIEGQRLFQVAETQDLTAKQRAQGINAELAELMKSNDSLSVIVDGSDFTPIIYNASGRSNSRQLMSVTGNDLQAIDPDSDVQKETLERQAIVWAEDIEAALEQARLERSDDYLLRAALISLSVLVATLGVHYLLGLLWSRYVLPLFPPTVTSPSPGTTGLSRPQFSLARFGGQLLLLGLRVSLGLWALLYVVKQFRFTRAWAYRLQDGLRHTFVGQSLPLGETSLSIADILALLGWLGGLILVAKISTNVMRSRLLQTSGLSLGMQAGITILARYAILFVGIIAILQLWGIDLSSLTLLASALGVGLGLGLQNIAKDISSGLVLVFERPIQVGDFIELGGKMGMVDRIGPRSTDIRTLDQVSIIVPNSRFLENDVINWSHRNSLSRIHIPVGVSYASKPEMVKTVLLQVGREHPDVVAAPAPEVFLQGFGDNSLDFELLVWIRKPQQYPRIRSDLNFAIVHAFSQVGIEIPFPQRDIHLSHMPLPVTLSDDSLNQLSKRQNLDNKKF
ncbi:mechanosensitive ion channel family protein [Leptothoe sp. PORK10 BA2]|uniref:mechanosensitive ion channel family protein n=1 Tax=Leptothoe sp. PORK10 BA2 TaxID=3110254 RepID=UPI002B1FC09F|nr:mechanosensitive ion channel domain-containing protein [Leptothoe sp. PORK10 BA2]MEA5466234.1 mechanosensitive ion channel domain-containing protein [Leptothoe sp. PORK10 BA2]